MDYLKKMAKCTHQVAQNLDARNAWDLVNSRETFRQLSQAVEDLRAIVARLGRDLGVEEASNAQYPLYEIDRTNERAEKPEVVEVSNTALHTHSDLEPETKRPETYVLYKVQCQKSGAKYWYSDLESAEAAHPDFRTIEKKRVLVCYLLDDTRLILEGDVVSHLQGGCVLPGWKG